MLSKFKYLKNHQGFIRYFKNTSWMMLEQVLRIFSGLFVGIWIARYLGPEKFGLLSYVLAFTAIFGSIAKLGLDSIVVRELVNTPEKCNIILGTSFWIKMVGAFFVISLTIIILQFTSNDVTTKIYIFIITIGLIFQSFEIIEFYFQSQVLGRIISICKITQLSLSSLIKVFLVVNEAELFYFVLATLFDIFILAISYCIAYLINQKRNLFNIFDWAIAKLLLKDSWPLVFSAFVVMIYMRIDQIMIKEILSEYHSGIYSSSVRLSEAWYFIPTVIASSIFPAIIKYKNLSEDIFYEKFQYFLDLLVYIGLSIAGFIIIYNIHIIKLTFGDRYAESSSVLAIHAVGGVFVSLAVAQGKFWVTYNLQKQLLFITASCAILNIIFNYFFIQRNGIDGAAFATVISYFLGAFVLPYFVPSARKMLFHSYSSFNFIRVIKCLIKK